MNSAFYEFINFMRTVPDPLCHALGANQLLDFKVLMIIYAFTNMHGSMLDVFSDK